MKLPENNMKYLRSQITNVNGIIFLLALLLVSHALPMISQDVKTDSLYTVWQDRTQPDSTRALALNDFISAMADDITQDSSLNLIDELIEFSRLHDFARGHISGLSFKIYLYVDRGKYSEALEYAKKRLQLCQALNDKTAIAEAHNQLGFVYQRMGNDLMSVDCYLNSLRIWKELNNRLRAAGILNNIGNIYYSQKDYRMAQEYYQRCLDIAEEAGHTSLILMAINNIGNILKDQEIFTEAITYYKRGLELNEKRKDKESTANSLIRIGVIYSRQDSFSKAHEFFQRGLRIYDQINNRTGLAKTYSNIGDVYLRQSDYETARNYHEQSLKIWEELGNKPEMIWSLNNTGRAYLKLGNYKAALTICARSFSLSEDIIQLSSQYTACKCLYQSYKGIGETDQALIYLEKLNEIDDSLRRDKTSMHLQKMEFDRLAFEHELEYQKNINRQKSGKNITIILGIIVFLISIGLLFRLRYIRNTQAALQEKNRIIESEKEKAKASEKAKQQFLANMSHEIRTPMNAIKGMTDILLRRNPSTEQQGYLNAIKESSNSLLVIINDILDLSKVESGKIQLEQISFSLRQVVENVVAVMRFKAEEKGLLLKTDLDMTSDRNVIGDPTRLHQILLNLVGNAIKFTEKGIVTIQLDTEQTDSSQVMAKFCVSDTGVGVGQDRLEKIFESFEQAYADTSRKFGGTGLGLSISRKLVEIQDGRIWAESEKGRGSRFYVSIPFPYAPQKDMAPSFERLSEGIDPKVQLTGIKILLVEDNAFNAIVAREELEDAIENVDIEVAENGVIAVEKVIHSIFDIILMDVQMPVMNGYEATQKIRALKNGKANIPIIAMTANVLKEEVKRCYDAGMNDFIGKPFDTQELLGKIYKLQQRVSKL